jgi:hypothetical protein
MPNETFARDGLSDEELTRLYGVYNGRDASAGAAGIGIQAREGFIRKLIEELRRQRERRASG